jgi:very-short-patch-repair endonuclease
VVGAGQLLHNLRQGRRAAVAIVNDVSMDDVGSCVASLGGMAQKQSLARRGARDLDLTRAVRRGEVTRARQGWYTTMPDDHPAVRAVRVGGRLTGISAVIAAGGWVLGSYPLHVSVHDNAARLRSPFNRFRRLSAAHRRGVFLHWDNRAIAGRGTVTAVAILDALERVILDEPLEVSVAALDWALHTDQIDRIDFETLIMRLPRGLRYIRDWVDVNCESLPESLSRTRLRLRGHRVVSQVPLDNGQRIDLLVDGHGAVDTDGEEFHLTRFEQDRNKDFTITIAGMHALRPTARMVFRDWNRVLQGIETAISIRHGSPLPFAPRKPSAAWARRRSSTNRAPRWLGPPP